MHLAEQVLTVDQVAKQQAAALKKQRQIDAKKSAAQKAKKAGKAVADSGIDWGKWIFYGALGVVGFAALKSMKGGKNEA